MCMLDGLYRHSLNKGGLIGLDEIGYRMTVKRWNMKTPHVMVFRGWQSRTSGD